jgi:hypothetical protein
MHRLFAPLGRFLLALVALTTFATLPSCSESDNRPLVVVKDPVPPGTSSASVGRVDVKVTTPSGPVVQSFTAEEAAKGNLGIYLPGGTTGAVTVVVVVYDKDGNVLVASPVVSIEVSPGKVQTTAVWTSGSDASVDAEQLGPDGPVVGIDAGIDGPRGGDVLAPGEVGIDLGVPDARADLLVPDAPLPPDGPLSAETAPPVDVAVDVEPVQPDLAIDTTPAIPVWYPAENIQKDPLNSANYPEVAVDRNSQDAYVAWYDDAGVKVRRFNYKTQAWEATKIIDNRGSCVKVHVGVDAKGNVIATWNKSSSSDKDQTLYGIWSSSSTDGVAWSPPYHVVTGNTWTHELAVAANGTARVVYSMRTTTNVDPLFGAYFDGNTWTNNTTPIYDPNDPNGFDERLVVNDSGDGFVIFKKYDSASYASIAAATLTGKTGASTPMLIDDITTVGIWDRDIALNKKGTIVVVWGEYSSSSTALKLKTYNSTNGWSTSATTIGSIGYAGSLVAVLDESDMLTLAWQQALSNGTYNTLSLRGKVNGAWGDVTPLETDNTAGDLTQEESLPRLALDGSGNVLAAWRKEINGPDSEIYSLSQPTKTYAIYGCAYRNGAWQKPVSLFQRDGVVALRPSLAVSDKGFGIVAFDNWSTTSKDTDLNNVIAAFYR